MGPSTHVMLCPYWTGPHGAGGIRVDMAPVQYWRMWHVYRAITLCQEYDDVMAWNSSPRHWPFVKGIHRSLMVSPVTKGPALQSFGNSLLLIWTSCWMNSQVDGGFRHLNTHVMSLEWDILTNGCLGWFHWHFIDIEREFGLQWACRWPCT